jgi:hypothetical protein
MLKFQSVKKLAVLLFLLTYRISVVWAADPHVLSITEYDQDGGENRFIKSPSIADVNSRMEITINKNLLRERVVNYVTTPVTQQLISQADFLRKTAVEGLQLLPDLSSELESFVKHRTEPEYNTQARKQARLDLRGRVDKLIVQILAERYAPRGSALRESINLSLEKTKGIKDPVLQMIAQYHSIFEAATAQAERLNAEFNNLVNANLLKKEGVYIRLGAFISTAQGDRPIHLPGFDLHPLDERYEVTRFNYVLTDQQKAELQRLTDLAPTVQKDVENKGIAQALTDVYKELLPLSSVFQNIPSLDPVKAQCATMQKAFENDKALLQKTDAEVAEKIGLSIDNISGILQAYENFLLDLSRKYSAGGKASALTDDKLLIETNADFATVRDRTLALPEQINKEREKLESYLKDITKKELEGFTLSAEAQSFAAAAKEYFDELDKFMRVALVSARNLIDVYIYGKQMDGTLSEFGDKVLKLDIDSLPVQTEFDLINTGVRNSGDSVIVKLVAGSATQSQREMETNQIMLFRALIHVDTTVNLIFARNEGIYQVAPSYSILLKLGCRRSVLYNRLIDIGIGLNIAALDFNKDSTQELGIGATVTAFRDYIQAGYGYNVNIKQYYWFFGLKLPLPTM